MRLSRASFGKEFYNKVKFLFVLYAKVGPMRRGYLPEAWLVTLRDAVLNRPRPIDWQECVRTSDLPGNAWTWMNDNGQGKAMGRTHTR